VNEEIKRRLVVELNKIGWQRVWQAQTLNRSLFSLLFPDERGGLMFREKNKRIDQDEAAAAVKELKDVARAIGNLKEAIGRVTPARRFLINHAFAGPDEHETGVYVDQLDAIFQVMSGALTDCVEAGMDAMGPEILKFHTKGGQQKFERAYRVATQLAEIYVLGLGKMPDYSSIRQVKPNERSFASQSDKPTTLYGCVTENVFKILDIPGGTRNPCEQAIEKLKDDRFEALMTMRQLRGRRISLLKP